jgi:hypothetical protein
MVDNVVLGVDKMVDHTLAEVEVALVLLLSKDHLSVWPQVAAEVVAMGMTTTKIQESLVEYILGQLHRFIQ